MGVVARLTGFAVLLVVAFALAFGVGAAMDDGEVRAPDDLVEPDPATAGEHGPDGHGSGGGG